MARNCNESGSNGVIGNSPQQWRKILSQCLDRGDSEGLKKILIEFSKEIKKETKVISNFGQSPLVDRLLEHARRLICSIPNKTEGLKEELTNERRLWADFRQKYRDTFVPKRLQPYVDDLGMFLAPTDDRPRYDGFEKYFGNSTGYRSEAVTLFDPAKIETGARNSSSPLPNFLSSFLKYERHFTVHRAYRANLPRGAGEECIFEHILRLSGSPIDLFGFSFENVQNSKTYDVFVNSLEGKKELMENPGTADAPLVRLGKRLIERTGKKMGKVRVSLDPFGFLDLHIEAV